MIKAVELLLMPPPCHAAGVWARSDSQTSQELDLFVHKQPLSFGGVLSQISILVAEFQFWSKAGRF